MKSIEIVKELTGRIDSYLRVVNEVHEEFPKTDDGYDVFDECNYIKTIDDVEEYYPGEDNTIIGLLKSIPTRSRERDYASWDVPLDDLDKTKEELVEKYYSIMTDNLRKMMNEEELIRVAKEKQERRREISQYKKLHKKYKGIVDL